MSPSRCSICTSRKRIALSRVSIFSGGIAPKPSPPIMSGAWNHSILSTPIFSALAATFAPPSIITLQIFSLGKARHKAAKSTRLFSSPATSSTRTPRFSSCEHFSPVIFSVVATTTRSALCNSIFASSGIRPRESKTIFRGCFQLPSSRTSSCGSSAKTVSIPTKTASCS